MKKIISAVAGFVFLFLAAPVSAGLGTIEYYNDENGMQCVEFTRVSYQQTKTVCIHDIKLKETEKEMFKKAFSSVFEKAPNKSWCEIISFLPQVARVHIRFSDGQTYYAVGMGDSFDEAAKDLIKSFGE